MALERTPPLGDPGPPLPEIPDYARDLRRELNPRLRPRNIGGYVTYVNRAMAVGPYFSTEIRRRINRKLAVNVAVTGEAGISKSYSAIFLAMLVDAFFDVNKQVVFDYGEFMDALVSLGMGKPIVFDEPSYAMGKREWYKDLNKALVKTIESMRFKVHPLFIPVINLNLLDKTVRRYLMQFCVHLTDRGEGTVFKLYASQWRDQLYRYEMCRVKLGLFDKNLCPRDTCLGCRELVKDCQHKRAQYERKKASIQETRYERDRDDYAEKESSEYTMRELTVLANDIRHTFYDTDKEVTNIIKLIVGMRVEYNLNVSQFKAQQLREHLKLKFPDRYVSS